MDAVLPVRQSGEDFSAASGAAAYRASSEIIMASPPLSSRISASFFRARCKVWVTASGVAERNPAISRAE